jgi:DNA invertase Pin-like site-specific DNA recombinase
MIDWAEHIAKLAATAAGSSDAAPRIEAELREQLGGQRIRIDPRPPVTRERIDSELRQRKTVAIIASELGVSRATVYRRLGTGGCRKRDAR